jgi:hypothetical protein
MLVAYIPIASKTKPFLVSRGMKKSMYKKMKANTAL